MKPTEAEIENLLRSAPQPRPPAGLKDRLLQQLPHPAMKRNHEIPQARSLASRHRAEPPGSRPQAVQTGIAEPGPGIQTIPAGRPHTPLGWLANWWPALAAAGFALACLAVLATQHSELNELRRQVEALKRELAAPAPASPPAAEAPASTPGGVVPGSRDDLERLRGLKRQLSGEVAALEALRAENEKLHAQALSQSGLTPAEVQPMLDARAKARSIACVNNLKQLGLAARIWATDHGDILPPDFLTMSHQIASLKILVCPEDASRQPAENWSVFTPANTSYEFLAPSGSETEPMQVVFFCPIHGHICLADGSVQAGVAKTQPQNFVRRGEKIFFEPPRAVAPVGSGAVPQMDPPLMERYGLRAGAATTGVPPTYPPKMTPELMRRYGLLPSNYQAAPNVIEPEPEPAP